MYIALKQAIAGHSPTIMPPASKPLVLAGPFGAACRKGELLHWLLREHGDKLELPEMVTTKARGNGVEASPTFRVNCSLTWLCALCYRPGAIWHTSDEGRCKLPKYRRSCDFVAEMYRLMHMTCLEEAIDATLGTATSWQLFPSCLQDPLPSHSC